jgi:hypothetical protein
LKTNYLHKKVVKKNIFIFFKKTWYKIWNCKKGAISLHNLTTSNNLFIMSKITHDKTKQLEILEKLKATQDKLRKLQEEVKKHSNVSK